MHRIDHSIVTGSSIFTDEYDVYIDDGKGKPIKVNENHTIITDIHKFLFEKQILTIDRSKTSVCQNDQIELRNFPTTFTSCSLKNNDKIRNRTKLGLRIAVNGVSKSIRDPVLSSNFNLFDGDSGDDAGIIVKTNDTCFVALADGAGGNRALGLNPLDFARAVLRACETIVHQKKIQADQLPELILCAMQQVESSPVRGDRSISIFSFSDEFNEKLFFHRTGSSTFCCLALDRNQRLLRSLNIGDSGFIVYRNHKIYRRSECTNDPYSGAPRQLFALDGSDGLPIIRNELDVLEQSSCDRIPIELGDLIILSSDGLWDVIESDQLRTIIEQNRCRSLQTLAKALLQHAIQGYFMNNRDDILIIVCQVVEL